MNVKEEHKISSNKAASAYQKKRVDHWNAMALRMDSWVSRGLYYHQRITDIYRFLVPSGMRVLEIGCGKGDLLASLKPSYGVGIDFSAEMIQRAQATHPEITFIQYDAHEIDIHGPFDIIILSDIVNDLWDVQAVFENIKPLCTPSTRLIINSFSRVWELPLILTQKLGLSTPMLPQNWLTVDDISNMLNLVGFEVTRNWLEILLPLNVPVLDRLFNSYLVKIWPFTYFGLTNFIVARPRAVQGEQTVNPTASVIIAARNEAGNIEEIFQRTPEMGGGTEMIFVEGNSKDNTYEAIEEAIARHPERRARLFKQPGKGKGDAVRLGFQEASGDILMILDADMTVPPEDLPRFYEALASGEGDFINGVRLIYPMEKQAMRYMNFLGNKFFSLAFSWLFGQPIKDTLCGTKVMRKTDYEILAANRSYFGNFDPFGDFDLLLGAAKMNLKIVELPIRYAERKYGDTNIDRWRHGLVLLRMVLFAMRKIKFI